MKKLSHAVIVGSLLLAACNGGAGISGESSRPPAGNPNGVVLVQKFSDLQCPACRAAHEGVTGPLLEQYGDVIRFQYEHFPLRSIHRYALEAAEASECMADQGKFWEFVDMIFENQQQLNSEQLRAWADQLQADMSLFEQCLSSQAKRDTVLEDYKKGRALGITGTPTFFVNGQRVQTGFDTLSEAIEQAAGGATMPL